MSNLDLQCLPMSCKKNARFSILLEAFILYISNNISTLNCDTNVLLKFNFDNQQFSLRRNRSQLETQMIASGICKLIPAFLQVIIKMQSNTSTSLQ